MHYLIYLGPHGFFSRYSGLDALLATRAALLGHGFVQFKKFILSKVMCPVAPETTSHSEG